MWAGGTWHRDGNEELEEGFGCDLAPEPVPMRPWIKPEIAKEEAMIPVLLHAPSQGLLLNRQICRRNIAGREWNPSRSVCGESHSREETECSRREQKREIIGVPERFEPAHRATTTLH